MQPSGTSPQVRIVYILLAHRMMDQLARLIRVLDDGTATFFVHLDKRAGAHLWDELQSQLHGVDVRPIPRHPCYWGSYELVRATLEGIRALVDSKLEFDRAVLLSGQDYPIKSLSYIRQFFSEHAQDEFLECFSFLSENRWSHWPGAGNARSRAWGWHLRFRSRWLHTPISRRFPMGMTPHGGSQWWALSRPCIEYIDRFVREHPSFVRYYKHAFIPDEQFFQTLLANSPFADRIAGHDVTYVDADPPTPPRPATLGKHYLPDLLKSPKLFARKFDRTQDAEILQLLDALNSEAAVMDRPTNASQSAPAPISQAG